VEGLGVFWTEILVDRRLVFWAIVL
jgi:hypothetical protein